MCDYDLEIKRLDEGLQIPRTPKVKTRLNADLRLHYKTKYLNKEYSPSEYINSISSTIGKENVKVLTEEINLDPEYSESSTDEYSTNDEGSTSLRCYVCLLKRGENFSLLHEGFAHAGFCENCAKTLQESKNECPICRGLISGIMRVFQ